MKKAKRRQRGSGSIFRKPPNPRWFIQYYKDSKRIREATGTEEWATAAILLQKRLAEVEAGAPATPRGRAVKIEDLYKALRQRTEIRRPKRPGELAWRWKHLSPVFGGLRARELTTAKVNEYILERQGEGAANGTINRELTALKRMYKVGMQADPPLVERVPHLPFLKEADARQGFVEYPDFLRLRFAAESGPLWLQVMLELAYAFCWRRSELLGLRVRHLNFDNFTIRLDVGSTKNKEGREVAMTPRIADLLRLATRSKEAEDRILTQPNGRPVKDFRRAWQLLTVSAGLGSLVCVKCGKATTVGKCSCGSSKRKYHGLMVHDLRRSGAKALRRAGVPESVIMDIGGWKTESVFRRYAIVSATDRRDAMDKLEADRARMDSALEASKAPDLSPLPGGVAGKLQ